MSTSRTITEVQRWNKKVHNKTAQVTDRKRKTDHNRIMCDVSGEEIHNKKRGLFVSIDEKKNIHTECSMNRHWNRLTDRVKTYVNLTEFNTKLWKNTHWRKIYLIFFLFFSTFSRSLSLFLLIISKLSWVSTLMNTQNICLNQFPEFTLMIDHHRNTTTAAHQQIYEHSESKRHKTFWV